MSAGALLYSDTISASGTFLIGTPIQVGNQASLPSIGLDVGRIDSMCVQMNISNATATGGDHINMFIQHSVDGGVTWCDFIAFHDADDTTAGQLLQFALWNRNVLDNAGTAPTNTAVVFSQYDGSLTPGSVITGPVGDDWRLKWVLTGTTWTGDVAITARQILRTR